MLALSLETCLSHSDKVCTHEKDMWTGEIAQQLRALVSLPENLGFIPIPHMVANNCLYLQSQGIWHLVLQECGKFATALNLEWLPGAQCDVSCYFLGQLSIRNLKWPFPIAILTNFLHTTIEPSSWWWMDGDAVFHLLTGFLACSSSLCPMFSYSVCSQNVAFFPSHWHIQ